MLAPITPVRPHCFELDVSEAEKYFESLWRTNSQDRVLKIDLGAREVRGDPAC